MATPIKVRARISKIVDHADIVRSLFLEPERRIPRFRPGQFLHLAIDEYDPSGYWPESRAYSIASSPEERTALRLTISKKGPFSQRIFELKEGDTVWLKLPYGEFVVEGLAGREVVLVGGGTGITPFASLLASNENCDSKLRVFYGAQKPELLLYADVIRDAAKRIKDYRYQMFCEQNFDSTQNDVAFGRLNIGAMVARVDDATSAIWYLSGPAVMIDAFRKGLGEIGVPAENIRVDEWG